MNQKAISEWIQADKAYLVPIGDIHLGDRGFTRTSMAKLRGYIDWIRDEPLARCILMGDIFNTATRDSATPPFQRSGLKDEMEQAIALFNPIKKKILGAIDGNHEDRLSDHVDYSPTIPLCHALGVKYLGYSGIFKIGVGVTKRNVKPGKTARVTYVIYAHHTTGGGNTMGGRLNRVAKLRDIVIDADIYVGSHNHGLISAPVEGYAVDRRSGNVLRFRQYLIDCGGYLDWKDTYSERCMYAPLKIGSPRIRLDGKTKDVKVTL